MKKFLDWLFNRINIGDKFRKQTDLLGGTTELVATIIEIKKNTVVYTVSINNHEDKNKRINSIKRFRSIYKERVY